MGCWSRAKCAAVQTYPFFLYAFNPTVSFRSQSKCDSFHEGLVFSVHAVINSNEVILGLLLSILQSAGGGAAGSHPLLVGAGLKSGLMPEAGLNCGSPSNDWSGYPFCDQYFRSS